MRKTGIFNITILASLLFLGVFGIARALTMQEIIVGQTSGQVLGASTTGLVGYWNFDEGSGTTAADSSGNGNNGTLVNGPTWTVGKVGSEALSFDGSSGYVNAGSATSLNSLGPLTLSAWIYPTAALGSASDNAVIGKADDYYLGFITSYGNKLYFRVPLTNVNLQGYCSGSSFTVLNQWVHVAVSWNGVVGTGNSAIFYINGVPCPFTGSNGTGSRVGSKLNLYLGANYSTVTGLPSAYFPGYIDEVRVYNRALTASEILDIYNDTGSGALPPPPTGDTTAPSVPASVTATAISASAVNLSWSASTDNVGVTGYKVFRHGLQIGTTVSTSYSDSGLTASTNFTYVVSAYDAAGNQSAQSAPASATTQPTAPPPATTNTYWVSPTGAATWTNCKSDSPLNGTATCSLGTANTNAAAGDTVYLRGGTYSLNSLHGVGISPSHSGTCASLPCTGGVGASPIVFSAYAGETPILAQTNAVNIMAGILLNGKSWIKITGITFKNFSWYLAFIYNGASDNEISYSSFVADPGYQSGAEFIVGDFTGATASTNNWIHHNYFSRVSSSNPCGEAVDMVRLGNEEYNPWSSDNNNTFDYNYVEYAGHSLLVTNSLNNVVANNTFHNEQFISGCVNYKPSTSADTLPIQTGSVTLNTQSGADYNHILNEPIVIVAVSDNSKYMKGTVASYGDTTGVLVANITNAVGSGTYGSWLVSAGDTSISTSANTIGTGGKTFLTQPGMGYSYLYPIVVAATSDYSQAMGGTVKSYDSSSGVLVVTVASSTGSGTYGSWLISQKIIPQYDNPAYDGLYSHRGIGFGDENHYDDNHNLAEGNRIGFAGQNPHNGGANGLTFESPANIGRYNLVYGSQASGVYFKWPNAWQPLDPAKDNVSVSGNNYSGTGAVNNHVYNNTVYHNGYGWNPSVYGGVSLSYNGQGIAQLNYNTHGATTDNVIKNNIVYGNNQGDICQTGWYGNNTCTAAPYDTVVNNYLTANGDPKFINPDLSNPISQNLISTAHGYVAMPIPNLSLQASSPAINGGTYLTQASGAGSNSTNLAVNDAMYFQDGTWGSNLARGVDFFPDWIAIGTVTNTAQISSIDYATNTITLASPKTWSANYPIWLYKKSDGAVVLAGSAPDMGAYEYTGAATPPPDTTPPSAPTGVKVQ
jgi:hypothetical protein